MEPEDESGETFRWDNVEEASHCEASIKWWVGKCSFWRGLRGADIQHTLRKGQRGGKATLSSRLSEAMHLEGFLPSNGCHVCHLLYDFCSAWMRNNNGDWVLADGARSVCQYGKYLFADTIIGLFHCGNGKFQEEIFEGLIEYCERTGEELDLDEEAIACYLLKEIVVVGVSGSEMIRMLSFLTQMVWDTIGEDH
ncbi:hypothetical protein J3F84DRAFT_362374 [Trichoderma pleuroticola]